MSTWGFKSNLSLDNNKYLTLFDSTGVTKSNIIGLDINSNLNINSASGDLFLNSNNSGSSSFLNFNNSKNVIVSSKLAIGINSTSNVNANLTLVKNGFIGINTTQGNNDSYLGLAGSSSLSNTTGSRILLYGNDNTNGNNGNLNIYAGNSNSGSINLFTGNDINTFQILKTGTSNFSPNGSTIRLSISDTNSIFTHPVECTTGITTTTILSTGLTTGNINFTGILYQNSIPYINSQWSGTSGSVLYYGSGGNTLVGINTTNPTSTLTINGDLNVSGNTTLSNCVFTNGTIANIITNNVNYGIANIFSGSFIASNNESIPVNITGFTFNSSSIRSFTAKVTVSIVRSAGGNLYATFTLDGIQTDSGWVLYESYDGDNTGIDFSITNLGVIQYTSTNLTFFTNSTFRYSVTQITNTGTYETLLNPTIGSYIVDGFSSINFFSTNFTTTNFSITNFSISNLTTDFLNTGNIWADDNIYFDVGGSSTAGSTRMFIGSVGNVGINTTAPSFTLDVIGSLRVSSGTYLTTPINIATTTNPTSITGGSLNVSGDVILGNELIWSNTVSIGVPTFTNRSVGTRIVLAPTISGLLLDYSLGVETNNMWFGSPSGFKWYNNNTGASMQLTNSNLIVTGDILAFGTISDIRLKNNLQPITNGLDKINDLRPVTFNWKDDIFNVDKQGTSDSGFIAQEVERVIPHAVSEYPELNSGIVYKNMKHERIIPYLVSSIQELTKQNKQLLYKIEILEQKNF